MTAIIGATWASTAWLLAEADKAVPGTRAAIEKQDRAVREAEMGSTASAESLAADLKLAKTELRTLRAELARLKTGIALLRETEAERDQLREALKETEEKLESALMENHSSSGNGTGK